MARRILKGSASATLLVLCGLLLPAAAGTDRLTIQLPDRALTIALSSHGGSPSLTAESLARAFGATLQAAPGGAVRLQWQGRRLRFTANRRQVSTSNGTALLSAPPRQRGPALWLPVDAAALVARERFGAEQIRWDAKTWTLTVAGSAPEIRALRIGSHPDRTRVVLEAARPVDWAVTPEGEGRLVVALPGSALSPTIVRREYREGQLRSVEPVQGPSGAQVRLAFAGRTEQARWFALDHPFRIVVDLHRSPLAAAPPPAPDRGGPPEPQSPPSVSPAPAAPPRPGPGGPLTIVIDPGHGGKDTGAIGPRGLKEKDVVLDIGLRLRRLLTERLGARVILTRSDDTFVPLEERTAMANRARADFFISIHVNAAPQARATGVETYYLSREPSDLSARASAARENLVLNLEGIGPREQDSLKAVLWDMAESLHMQESSAMAEMLLEDLGRALRVETRGIKHGPFVVLMTAGMPSALVEVAFISNPSQERRLQDEAYRHSIAAALSEGVERFAHRYQRRIGMQRSRPGPS